MTNYISMLTYYNFEKYCQYWTLTSPHPLFRAARSPFEVRKAVVAARMLTGRYRTDQLARHWSKTNPLSLCQLPGCDGKTLGSLEHILLYCEALTETRSAMISHWQSFMSHRSYMFPLILELTNKEETFMQLLLDPSCLPSVLRANSSHSDILQSCFYLSRTWVYSHHLKRTNLQKTLM